MIDLTGYRLTFDDEFNARSISQNGSGTTWADIRSQWRFDSNSDIGFGHSSFVDPSSGYDPFKIQNGALTITAVPDKTPSGYPGSWESGLITTQGNFSQTYGYFEMRADLSDAKGGWDAFWMMPNTPAANPNKLSGWQELDIVEHYGVYNQGTYRWIHTTDLEPNKNPNEKLQVFSNNPTQVTGYHTYGMDWQKDKISFYFDGQFMGSRPTPSDMHGPMYLIANLATQSEVDQAGVPLSMNIDYIRAYSSDPKAVAVVHDTVSAPDKADPGLYGATSAVVASSSTVVPSTSTGPSTSGSQASAFSGSAASLIQSPSATSSSAEIKPDFSPTIDLHGSAAQAYRLYQAALDRAPDSSGLIAHAGALQRGLSLHDDALSFINSSEFVAKFGANISDQAFVSNLYNNVLDRAPDAVGNAYWINALTAHTMDRASVLVGFSESIENHAKVDPTITPAIQAGFRSTLDLNGSTAQAYRLYQAALDRAPDTAGLIAHASNLQHGLSLHDDAMSFINSVEFGAKFGTNTSDQAFVTALYNNVLDRAPDAAGNSYWLNALTSHTLDRASVLVGFSESVENHAKVDPAITTGIHFDYGLFS